MADTPKKGLFDRLRRREPEQGYSKEQALKDEPRNFINFFKLAARNLREIFTVNLMILLGNFPAWFAIFAYSGILNHHTTAPASPMFATLWGAMKAGQPVLSGALSRAALFGVHGVQAPFSTPSVMTWIFYGIAALTLFTFGPVSAGTTYLVRNIVKGEPFFGWSDFVYAIKRNLRQSILLGILDLLCLAIIGYDILFFYYNLGSAFSLNVMFYGILALALTYSVMRFYLYITLVTFDLGVFKIYKNAFIFAFLGLKRNLLGLSGVALVVFLNFGLFYTFVPLGLLLPLFLTFGLCSFIGAYAAWPNIQKYMIDPQMNEASGEADVPSGS